MTFFPTFDDFRQHASAILVPIEKRRKRYLTYFILCTSLALFIVSLTIPGYIKGLLGIFSISFLFFYLLLAPLSGYRHRIKRFGPHRLEYSLKHDLYTNLLSAFGEFKFVSSGNIPLPLLGKTSILPSFDRVVAEDYTVGILNDMVIKMAEASLIRLREGGKISFFNGLLILIDTSESRVRLRRNFSGRTVLAKNDQGQLRAEVSRKFPDVTHSWMPLSGYECLTSSLDESKRLLTPDLVKALADLHEIILNLKRQSEHMDTMIIHSLNALYDMVKGGLIDRFSLDPLPAEQVYDKQHSEHLDLTKRDPLSHDIDAANQGLRVELFEDKILIALPYPHDLFEPNSIFESPLSEEDIRIVYALMDVLLKITLKTDEVLCDSAE